MTDAEGPAPGDLWRYPYLWARQANRGETEGRKPRPCALALLRRRADGETEVLLLPVTSQPPRTGTAALPVPETERRRAGLDPQMPLWVIVDEFNADQPARSWYFEPGGRIGAFSPRFLREVQTAMIATLRARKIRGVGRR